MVSLAVDQSGNMRPNPALNENRIAQIGELVILEAIDEGAYPRIFRLHRCNILIRPEMKTISPDSPQEIICFTFDQLSIRTMHRMQCLDARLGPYVVSARSGASVCIERFRPLSMTPRSPWSVIA
jgi:hypothetical protein